MIVSLKTLLETAEGWSEEDQHALAEAAREIEARRTGVYEVSEDERAAIEEGLAQVSRGEILGESEMRAFWTRLEA